MENKRNNNQRLTKEKIVQRAIRLADADGFDKLSMRKLADSLGVEAMSLYHHVANKQALITEMVDSLIPTIDPAESVTDWRVAMKNRAHAIRAVFIAHPWLPLQIISGINIGPAMFAYINATIGYLVRAGFSYQMADYAWNMIDSYIYGFNLQSQNFPLEPAEYQNAASQYVHMIPQSAYPYFHGMTMQIIEGSHDGIQDFDFGLDILLDGLEEKRIQVIN